MKYSVITFGCRVNQADSLGVEEHLLAAGAVPASPEAADLVVVNTCSVTATADQGARQTIRRLARDNPGAHIVVSGCYATRQPDEVGALPNVFRVVPNDDKPRLLSLLIADGRIRVGSVQPQPDLNASDQVQSAHPEPSTAERFGDGEGGCGAAIEPGVAGRTAFTLRVQTGCAESCAYCIIPATRGTPRSVAVSAVLSEVERVASAGFKEIALTGVHLGSYGRDLTPASSLIDLLRALDRFADDRRRRHDGGDGLGDGGRVRYQPDLLFRISSLEPMDCSRDIVGLVSASAHFAPHFHLPLQHASHRVLAAMRRPYSIDDFASLVNDIRDRVPHASIGSDVIVGFPGETDRDFEQLADYLEQSPLTHLHVFPYSDRPGTAASRMGGRADGRVIRERGRRIREIGRCLAENFRAAQVGTSHRALTLEDGTLAVTGNYLKVRIPPGRARNEWVCLRLASQHHGELLGD